MKCAPKVNIRRLVRASTGVSRVMKWKVIVEPTTWSVTVAWGKSVCCSSTNPVGEKKRRSRNGKEVGAYSLNRENMREWVNEEGEEDVCGALDEDLS